MIDLRSDTVTKPTAAMREAIAKAEVGDDVFDEDPTIHRLQERVASILGKEEALLVPSGTMANTVSVLTHTARGDEVIVEEGCHVFNYESASSATFGSVQIRTIPTREGWFTAADVEARIRPVNLHHPPTRLVCMENTHNRAGGTIFPIGDMKEIGALCRERGIKAHLDGARLWNASAASGVPMAEYAECVDSVSVCLSKGLGAPVGSLVAGTAGFIARARKTRKMLGGGMRQAGVLAAAGLHALEHHVERLADDHENARRIAETLASIPGIRLDAAKVVTNIVIADVGGHPLGEAGITARLAKEGVLFLAIGPGRLRLVTHLDVSKEQAEEACRLFVKCLS
ncbi:MAG: low-specificity L-threonine aldolase [Candidatus Eisenbacteria bacterium]